MKFLAPAIASFFIAIAPCGLAQEKAADPRSPRELIADLSSDSFKVREVASRELWAMGDKGIELLRAASRSDDPEVSLRSAEVLEKVELAITPETPRLILDLIRSYRSAPQDQKVNFLNQLRAAKAYFQVLKLVSMEDAESRAALQPNINGIALLGAREAITRADLPMAAKLLEMSASDNGDMIALASLYRDMGLLKKGKDTPKAPPHVATDLWEITLLRVKGDIEGAKKIAAESKRTRLLAGLEVLSGDPTVWLRQNGFGNRDREALGEYVDIALKKWEGKNIRASDFKPLLSMLKSEETEQSKHAMSSLAALGNLAAAEKKQAKESPQFGFEYYLSLERVPEALELFGMDPVTPDYTAWVAGHFEKIFKAENVEQEAETSELLAELGLVAAFLERRGLKNELEAAFSAPMERLAKETENQFIDFLSYLCQGKYGAPVYAMQEAVKWAGDNEQRWEEIYPMLLGEEEGVSEWRDWIREMEPEISRIDQLKGMMALFGVGYDPDRLREKWIGKTWQAVGKADDDGKQTLVRRILALSVAHEDLANALKAHDFLESAPISNSIEKFLSAAGRWKEAAEMLKDATSSGGDSSPELHAYLAVHLRRAGMEKDAAVHDAWVEKLALGSARSSRLIGAYYSYGGDEERAAKWFQQAAFLADPAEQDFPAHLESYAMSKMEAQDWLVAASCYEAIAQVYASRNYAGGTIPAIARARLSADLAKALAILPENRERAIAILDEIHGNFAADGVLADEFFPLVKKAGLTAELNQWFGKSWDIISAAIAKYPASDNTRNTAAWFASRAGLKLDEAEKHLEIALALSPDQPAYLDTMAEVHFAQGDRKGAVEWSEKAVNFSPYDEMIRKQNRRFRTADLPDKGRAF